MLGDLRFVGHRLGGAGSWMLHLMLGSRYVSRSVRRQRHPFDIRNFGGLVSATLGPRNARTQPLDGGRRYLNRRRSRRIGFGRGGGLARRGFRPRPRRCRNVRLRGSGSGGDCNRRRGRSNSGCCRRYRLGGFSGTGNGSAGGAGPQGFRQAPQFRDGRRKPDQDQAPGQRRRAGHNERVAESELIDWYAESDRRDAPRGNRDTQHQQNNGHNARPTAALAAVPLIWLPKEF